MQGTRSSQLVSNIARAHGLRQTVPTHTRISLNRQLWHSRPQSFTLYTQRQFSQSSWLDYPRKDSQDKDSINREPTEYSKSGTDDGAAGQEEAAFDPSVTDPTEEMEKAGEGKPASDNPLDVSPANPDVSQQRDPTEGGSESSSGSSSTTSDRQRSSGGSSPRKGSKVA